jgi:hypothetical protein
LLFPEVVGARRENKTRTREASGMGIVFNKNKPKQLVTSGNEELRRK